MNWGDLLRYAARNIRRQRLRTVLTLIGIAIGVGTLTTLVSLGTGLHETAASSFQKEEVFTRITVLPAGTKQNLMRGGRGIGRREPLTDDLLEELEALPGVTSAYPDVRPVLTVELGPLVEPLEFEGVPTSALGASYRDALIAGDYWTDADGAGVIVLPSQFLDPLELDAGEVIGMKAALSRVDAAGRYTREEIEGAEGRVRFVRPDDLEFREVEVIGVYDSKAFGLSGLRVHTPLTEALALESEYGFRVLRDGYPSAIVKVGGRDDVRPVQDAIEAKGLDSISVLDWLSQLDVFFLVFNLVLGFFGGIGILVACFGIANTMVMTVLERTREIGVLKALGGRDRDVRRLFLTEAGLIGLLGGLLGVAGGWLLGATVNGIARWVATRNGVEGAEDMTLFVLPLWLALGALALATLVAIVAGLYPAWRAARLEPAVTLRME